MSVLSDPKDYAVWQDNHDTWTTLFDAAQAAVRNQAPDWYSRLMDEIRDKDDWVTDNRLATRGSSSSKLSEGEAFMRGYAGGR